MASRLLDQHPIFFDDDGAPCAGGTLTFKISGSSLAKDVYGEKALTTNLGNVIDLDSSGRTEVDVWLDGAYTVELRDSDGVQIWSRDNVEAPSELPDPTGEDDKVVRVVDGAFVLDDLRELPDYSGADDNDVVKIVGGVPVFGAPPVVEDYAGAELEQPVLLNERFKGQAVTATSTLAIDYALGSVVSLAHGTDIATLTFSNFGAANKWARMLIIRTKDASATTRTIAWGATLFPGGTDPTLTQTTGAVDVIELWSNGTTVIGRSVGAAFA
jgi:hypothetical protein